MYNKIILFFILSYLTVINQTAKACSCGCEVLGNYGVGGPIITMPAYTLPKGKVALNTSLRFQNVDQLSGADYARLNLTHTHAHSHDSEMLLTASVAYGLTDDLTISLSYPYRFLNGLKTHEEDNSIINGGNSIGFGDMTLLAKYRFLNGAKLCGVRCDKTGISNRLQAALLAGIKMPTGQTNERDMEGFRLGADEQPGTGSWDPIMGLAFSLPINNFSLDTSTIYRLSTQGIQQTTVGDVVSFNSAITYNFQSHQLFGQNIKPAAVLELNGIWQEKVEYQGIKDNGHGGLVMFLSPGLRAAINDYTVANFLIGFPIISDLNGIQPDTGIQLFAGLSRIF